MTDTRVETAKLSALNDLPVQGRVISGHLAKRIAEQIKSDNIEITPIRVGKIGDKIYPINDFETVMALRSANISQASVLVSDYPSMKDLLAAHVEKNFHPHGIDPLKIRQVIKYLMDHEGMDVDSACKLLMLDMRPELRGVAQIELEESARDIMLDMAEQISKKIHHVVTPTYYIRQLSHIDPAEQARAATEIMSSTLSTMISNENSLWMPLLSIKTMLAKYHDKTTESPVGERVAEASSIKDLGKKSKTKQSDEKTIERASRYIESDPDLLYVPLKGKQPDLLVNKKTGRVALAKESGETYIMTDDVGKSTYVLPESVTRYLGVDVDIESESLAIAKYSSIEKASELLGRAKHPEHKCVVISAGSLPRR